MTDLLTEIWDLYEQTPTTTTNATTAKIFSLVIVDNRENNIIFITRLFFSLNCIMHNHESGKIIHVFFFLSQWIYNRPRDENIVGKSGASSP